MELLLITPTKILAISILLLAIYIFAISIIYKNRAGLLPYLVLLLFPILGPLGIILGEFTKKKKNILS